MAVQKYDIRRPDAEGGGFEVRYWSPINSPVLERRGAVAYIIHRVEDVTEYVRLTARQGAGASPRDRRAAQRTRRGAGPAAVQDLQAAKDAAGGQRRQERVPVPDEPRAADAADAILGFGELLELEDLDDEQRENLATSCTAAGTCST